MESGFLEKVVLQVEAEIWLGFGGREGQKNIRVSKHREVLARGAYQRLSCACYLVGVFSKPLRGRKEGRKQGRSDQGQLEAGMVFKAFNNLHDIGTDQSEWTLALDSQHSCTDSA